MATSQIFWREIFGSALPIRETGSHLEFPFAVEQPFPEAIAKVTLPLSRHCREPTHHCVIAIVRQESFMYDLKHKVDAIYSWLSIYSSPVWHDIVVSTTIRKVEEQPRPTPHTPYRELAVVCGDCCREPRINESSPL